MALFGRRKKTRQQSIEINEGWPTDSPSGFVVFDIETTGLSPKLDRVIELGLIRTDAEGNPLGYWSSLVNPKRPVAASEIHGIRDSDVEGAPTFEECADKLLSMIQGQVLVAHNASFDHSFIHTELARSGWELPKTPVVCTMLESRHFLPGLSRKRLIDCVEALGISQSVEHRALGDASLTAAVFHFYLNGPVNGARAGQIRQLVNDAQTVRWPTEKTFPSLDVPASRKTSGSRPSRTSSPIFEATSRITLDELLSDDASDAEVNYGTLLLEALTDGKIEESELEALRDCAETVGLDSHGLDQVHKHLLHALAREAWKDGVVTRNEQQDILTAAVQLGLSEDDGRGALKDIESARIALIGAQAKSLPNDWSLGDPLRVGDRVAITGCADEDRDDLELSATAAGLRVTGSVSGRTCLLVSDGTTNGNKFVDAQRLGIRIVGPAEFRKLVEYVQPAVTDPGGRAAGGSNQALSRSVSEEIEHLVCTKCTQVFERVVSRGRKPHMCPSCK